MDITLSQLIVAFLLFGVVSSLVLVWALQHTVDGCEDETGFHPDSGGEKAKATKELAGKIDTRHFLAS